MTGCIVGEAVYVLMEQTTYKSTGEQVLGIFSSGTAAKQWFDHEHDYYEPIPGDHNGRTPCGYCQKARGKWDGAKVQSVKWEDDDVYYRVWVEKRMVIA